MNTAKKQKNKRLASYNQYSDGQSKEWIEIDEYGTVFWKAEDYSELNKCETKKDIERVLNDGKNNCFVTSYSFPVDLYFVEDFFEKCGRILDRSLLPENVCLFPYGEYSRYPDCIALRIIRQQEYDRLPWIQKLRI